MPWSDFRDDAHWKALEYTSANWAAHLPYVIALMTLPGNNLFAVMCDFMHAKHMGTDAYLFGSVLWLLCYEILPGTPQCNVAVVWAELQEFQPSGKGKTYYGGLKLSMFVDPSEPRAQYPKLKGRAAEVRHLGDALYEVWCRHMDEDNTQHKWIRLGLKMSRRMENPRRASVSRVCKVV